MAGANVYTIRRIFYISDLIFFLHIILYLPIQYSNKSSINRALKRIALVIARTTKLSNKFFNPNPKMERAVTKQSGEQRRKKNANTGWEFVGIIHLPKIKRNNIWNRAWTIHKFIVFFFGIQAHTHTHRAHISTWCIIYDKVLVCHDCIYFNSWSWNINKASDDKNNEEQKIAAHKFNFRRVFFRSYVTIVVCFCLAAGKNIELAKIKEAIGMATKVNVAAYDAKTSPFLAIAVASTFALKYSGIGMSSNEIQ